VSDGASRPAASGSPPGAVTRRRNHGRGHSYLLDGDRVDSVTWIISNGIPKPALIDWAARTTAEFAVDHWDELAEESATKRLRALERARWDTTKAAGARGTVVHQLAMRLAAGEEVTVPEEAAGHVDAYLAFVRDWQPEELLVEVPVFNRSARYAGTLDLVAKLIDGATWLLDWKTAGSGIWPESAVQLAAYRNAEFYLDDDGAERPLPPIDACGAVWLRADGYDLYPVEAGEHTFRLFRYAQQVAKFSQADKESYIGDSLPAPARAA
jgi:hypothetical protein